MFGGLDEFFAPARRHIEEERRREALTREDPGDADPARGPVDLTSGRVTIRLPRPPEVSGGRGDAGSERRVEEVQAVGQGGGLASAGDAELGEDVGDVDAGRLR
ncbi:DUF6191 domain-containing protein [Streptomyces sp. TLI_105]|uniref:DUF6191 domain-containing protein n=1 Tax=Streptomyces sp. TLI_105 TaxID=1881019 RepID=UPI0008963AA9|nr:DUF6191 domain-containing protein [Streptomyces sp. TLI_105]SEC43104.1 hypothetical protein SAMN05428939_2357 [Streptomyces sp. TLI_105]